LFVVDIFFCFDCVSNVQEKEAETARLLVELEQARQHNKALQQVLSRCYSDHSIESTVFGFL
jgi:hypothetical protein